MSVEYNYLYVLIYMLNIVWVLIALFLFCVDGELMQVRENEFCLLEIPKGTAELGLRVSAVAEMKGVSNTQWPAHNITSSLSAKE